MLNNFYTFFITSNINTSHSTLTPDQRFIQTLQTIHSIRAKVPGAVIAIADNSYVPLTNHQVALIKSMVDLWVEYKNNLFSNYVNVTGTNKGLNELLVYEAFLEQGKEKNLIGKRIFKISGRYLLKDTFDPNEYEKPLYFGKYVFTKTIWLVNPVRPVGTGEGDTTVVFYNTALWSMCSTLVSNYVELMPNIFKYMMKTGHNLEISHRDLIPQDKLVVVPAVHGCGLITNGEYTEF